MKPNWKITLSILFIFTLQMACAALQGRPPEPQTVKSTPLTGVSKQIASPVPADNQPTKASLQEPAGEPASPSEQTKPPVLATLIPSRTPTPEAEPLLIVSSWFSEDDTSSSNMVYYGVIVENPNPDLAIKQTSLQAVAYDTEGTILATQDIDVFIIFPGERLGIAGMSPLMIPENMKVDRIDFQVRSKGEAVNYELPGSPFFSEKEAFINSEYSPNATGVINNTIDGDISYLYVSAFAYDANGNIVGAGLNSYIPYLPSHGKIPVAVQMHIAGEVRKIVFFPMLTASSEVLDPDKRPLPQVLSSGGNINQYGSGSYAFVIENPADAPVYQNLSYLAAYYDSGGTILGTSAGQIPVIFPGEKLGVSNYLSLPEDADLSSVEVQVFPAPYEYDSLSISESNLTANPLTAEQVAFLPGNWEAKVTGIVVNTFSKDVQAMVTVVAYDENGAIIGGNFNYISLIPAGGQTAVEVSLYLESDPAKVELYPSMSSISN